jgi:hypothetical protein
MNQHGSFGDLLFGCSLIFLELQLSAFPDLARLAQTSPTKLMAKATDSIKYCLPEFFI